MRGSGFAILAVLLLFTSLYISDPTITGNVVDEQNIIAKVNFNENIGSHVLEETSLATIQHGASWVSGIQGSGLDFNKSATSIPISAPINQGAISVWLQIDNSAHAQDILGFGGSQAKSDVIKLDKSGNNIRLKIVRGSHLKNGGYQQIAWARDVSYNTWHHIVANWDENTLEIYFDGMLFETDPMPQVPFTSELDYFFIGGVKNQYTLIQDFTGAMDNLVVFNKKLSPSQVDSLFLLQDINLPSQDLIQDMYVPPKITISKGDALFTNNKIITVDINIDTQHNFSTTWGQLSGQLATIASSKNKANITLKDEGIYHFEVAVDDGQTIVNKNFTVQYLMLDQPTNEDDKEDAQIITQGGNTYYISPQGDDKNDGNSLSTPWATFDRVWQSIQRGDTLILMDGVYRQSIIPQVPSGTDYITLKAQNDGKAIIDGEGVRDPIRLLPYGAYRAHYMRFEGIVARNGDNTNNSRGIVWDIQSDHNIFKRVTGYDASIDDNSAVFSFQRNYNLLEDGLAYGTGRKMIYSSINSQYTVIRRSLAVWGEWRGSFFCPGHIPWGENIETYNADNAIIENSIGFARTPRPGGGINIFAQSGASNDNNSVYGSIVARVGMDQDGSQLTWPCPYPGSSCTNCWDPTWLTHRSGMHIGNPNAGYVNNVIFQDVLSVENAGLGFAVQVPADTNNLKLIRGTFVKNGIGLPIRNQGCDNPSDIRCEANRSFQVDDAQYFNEFSDNYIEGTSYQGGGANLRYRYINGIRQDGTGGTPVQYMWPWPMEDRVVEALGFSPTCIFGGLVNNYTNYPIANINVQDYCTGSEYRNIPPYVYAGQDITLQLPQVTTTLSADVTDDSKTLTYTWTKISGPTVVIASPNNVDTEVTLSSTGTYDFRIEVYDGEYTSSDIVSIHLVDEPLTFPAQSEWIDRGIIFSEGEQGEPDRYLSGAFANSIVFFNNKFFHYYQGSPYYDDVCESVADRNINLAISVDGLNWQKYDQNPVLTHNTSAEIEEGAVSSGAFVSNNEIIMYYGANTAIANCEVTANATLAVSTDGSAFNIFGSVFSGHDNYVWGNGDEIFPIGAYQHEGITYVFYTPNGVAQSRKLGVAFGSSIYDLSATAAVNAGTISAWGSVSIVKKKNQSLLFVNENSASVMNIYSFDPTDPTQIAFLDSYSFTDCAAGSIYYDEAQDFWIMLCRDLPGYTGYRVKTIGNFTNANVPIEINAGADQNISEPMTNLNATVNYDDGSYAYAWQQISGPSIVQITSPNNKDTLLTGLIEGTYVFRFTANNQFSTVYDEVQITYFAQSCILQTVAWSKTIAIEGEEVQLNIIAPGCDGEEISFTIFEDDLDADDPASQVPNPQNITLGRAIAQWTAEWQCDGNIFGVCTSGDPEWYFTAYLSSDPNKNKRSNLLIVQPSNQLAVPQITPSQVFSDTVEVSMFSVVDSQIYYTTDGSDPDKNDVLYIGPIILDKTTQIRARAFKTGFSPSLQVISTFTKVDNGRILNVQDNTADYPQNIVPKYEKFEATFSVQTNAVNYFLPYDANPPLGIDPTLYDKHKGITVEGIMLPPGQTDWNNAYVQPGFYYRGYDHEIKQNRDWIYPNENDNWKLRFSPNTPGTWNYKIRIEDAQGIAESHVLSFTVEDSSGKGFIKVSEIDPRYFAFDNGEPFVYHGMHISTNLDDPIVKNTDTLQTMDENNIRFVRAWISSLYGSAWTFWQGGRNLYNGYLPRTGLYPLFDPDIGMNRMTMRIDYEPQGDVGWFDSCRHARWNDMPSVKQDTNYKLLVRYKGDVTDPIIGPRLANPNYGLVFKLGGWHANCSESGTSTVISTYGVDDTGNWATIDGIWNSGTNDFLPRPHIALENVQSGRVYIDSISLREDFGDGTYGPEIMVDNSMEYHLTPSEEHLYALDTVLDLAHQHDIYYKLVVSEKNDKMYFKMKQNGGLLDLGEPDNLIAIYGDGRNQNMVRWLQQAWWRYLQARFGHSTNIHSWELINEGDPSKTNHYIQTDEMGKYLHCNVFGQSVGLGDGQKCEYDHPNKHMVTTSFWTGLPGQNFWSNTKYPNVDYVDLHAYISTGDYSVPEHEEDTAKFRLDYSREARSNIDWYANLQSIATKPIVRGETGIDFINKQQENPDLLNDTQGTWLHNFLWAGVDAGAMYELYWWDGAIGDSSGPDGVKGLYEIYKIVNDFLSQFSLNNGYFQNISAISSSSQVRLVGQHDTVNQHAYLWIQHKEHTWRNVVDAIEITPIDTTVELFGFMPDTQYSVEWWNTTAFDASQYIQSTNLITSDSSGKITLQLTNLLADTAVVLQLQNRVSNHPPNIHVGSDLTISLPTNSVQLDATVTDDGLPSNTLTNTWSKISGPGTVTFGNVNAVDTTASFSQAGTYVLRLTSSDGVLQGFDELTITVTQCQLLGAEWTTTQINNGSIVGLRIYGAQCDGQQASFAIYEQDELQDDLISTAITPAIFNSNLGQTQWTALYQPDGLYGINDPPEFYFIASVGSQTYQSSLIAVYRGTAVQRFNGQPSGMIQGTQTALSLETNYAATCKYSKNPDQSINTMQPFDETLSTTHTKSISISPGLYTYYVKCQDAAGTVNVNDYLIQFSVELICEDLDGDTYSSTVGCGILDCNDNNANIYPSAAEVCNNIDDNCNSQIDENLMRDCSLTGQGICGIGTQSCSAGTWSACPPPQVEVCGNGIDEDCNNQDLLCPLGPRIPFIRTERRSINSVELFWQTDIPSTTYIHYRIKDTNDFWTVMPNQTGTQHRQLLLNLQPDTFYEYQLIAMANDQTFTTKILPFTTFQGEFGFQPHSQLKPVIVDGPQVPIKIPVEPYQSGLHNITLKLPDWVDPSNIIIVTSKGNYTVNDGVEINVTDILYYQFNSTPPQRQLQQLTQANGLYRKQLLITTPNHFYNVQASEPINSSYIDWKLYRDGIDKTTDYNLRILNGVAYYDSFNTSNVSLTLEGTKDCAENWVCADWDVCIDGSQGRTCTDTNACGTTTSQPAFTQTCTVDAPSTNSGSGGSGGGGGGGSGGGGGGSGGFFAQCQELWTCSEWSTCDVGRQTRICEDQRNCKTQKSKPEEIQTCNSCSDGILNGDETGVDCGGSCDACVDENTNSVDEQENKGDEKPVNPLNADFSAGKVIIRFDNENEALAQVAFRIIIKNINGDMITEDYLGPVDIKGKEVYQGTLSISSIPIEKDTDYLLDVEMYQNGKVIHRTNTSFNSGTLSFGPFIQRVLVVIGTLLMISLVGGLIYYRYTKKRYQW